MIRPRIVVDFGGEVQSLRKWAEEVGVCYDTVLRRWHVGVRDPDALLEGLDYVRRPITPEDIKWLRLTKYARSGQLDEWEIACDLIGVPRARADELKEALCSR